MHARRLLQVKLPEDELTQIVTEAVEIEREFVTDALPVRVSRALSLRTAAGPCLQTCMLHGKPRI